MEELNSDYVAHGDTFLNSIPRIMAVLSAVVRKYGEVAISQEDLDAVAVKGSALLEGATEDGKLLLRFGSMAEYADEQNKQ